MKKILNLWPRTRLYSDTNGALIRYLPEEKVIDQLGAADGLLIEVFYAARSSASATVTAHLFLGGRSEFRPSATLGGAEITLSNGLTAPGVVNLTISTPFHGRSDYALDVQGSGAQEWVEVEVNVTLRFD